MNLINCYLFYYFFLHQCSTTKIFKDKSCPDYFTDLVEHSSIPLIDQSHPGSSGNKRGYEKGTVFMHKGELHMFVTEEINGSVNTRTGHWKSTNAKGWDRKGTVQTVETKTLIMLECNMVAYAYL